MLIGVRTYDKQNLSVLTSASVLQILFCKDFLAWTLSFLINISFCIIALVILRLQSQLVFPDSLATALMSISPRSQPAVSTGIPSA